MNVLHDQERNEFKGCSLAETQAPFPLLLDLGDGGHSRKPVVDGDNALRPRVMGVGTAGGGAGQLTGARSVFGRSSPPTPNLWQPEVLK